MPVTNLLCWRTYITYRHSSIIKLLSSLITDARHKWGWFTNETQFLHKIYIIPLKHKTHTMLFSTFVTLTAVPYVNKNFCPYLLANIQCSYYGHSFLSASSYIIITTTTIYYYWYFHPRWLSYDKLFSLLCIPLIVCPKWTYMYTQQAKFIYLHVLTWELVVKFIKFDIRKLCNELYSLLNYNLNCICSTMWGHTAVCAHPAGYSEKREMF